MSLLKKIIAVTACPTGIAHTYMAAEALETAAKEKNIDIKVETRGSGGAQNVLTEEDIQQADAVIIAADTNVDLNRFSGKPVIQVPVADGIKKADELLEKAVKGEAPIFEGQATSDDDGQSSGGTRRPSFYRHLMNGVSHMLPFVVAGGLLIALSFLADSIYDLFSNTTIESSQLGSYTKVAQFFNTTGGLAFSLMLPILAAYIAYSIGDRPALLVGFLGGLIASFPGPIADLYGSWGINATGSGFLGALFAGFAAGYLILLLRKLFSTLPQSLEGIKPVLLFPLFGALLISIIMIFVNIVMGPINEGIMNWLSSLNESTNAFVRILLGLLLGGMMAIDMGGPINKAAYVFGTLTLTAQNPYSDIMAAVMVGGMVPPLGIAIATSIFKSRFNQSQLEAGKSNYVMGLSFITEGAIPFAAANPARVLPSIIIGSAVAGALSMAFGVKSPAPHGGIFILPLMQGWDWLLFIIALFVGSFVTALLLNVLLPKSESQE
mgnify:CR=1 FL=1